MFQVEDTKCDLLIIGAGPAGLMVATWAARLGLHARIIDKRGTKVFNGQADGLQARTLEIFDSFGFADRVWKESNHMIEICLWNPDDKGTIRRTDRIPDTIPGISRFQQVVLHQGRIERFFLDSLKKHSNIEVERGVIPEQLNIDRSGPEDHSAYPITVKIRHLDNDEATPVQNGTNVSDGLFRSSLAKDDTDDLIRKSQGRSVTITPSIRSLSCSLCLRSTRAPSAHMPSLTALLFVCKSNADVAIYHREGTTETVRAKYMVGCDGAHSWTRKQLGFIMEGEQTDFVWGVLDIIPITNFPDIRMRCAIHSADSGSVMVIPRENKLVRLYIQLNEINKAGEQVDRSTITPDIILRAAQKIMRPYSLTYDYCDWWTAYQIGQRVGDNFSCDDRVFLAGDAVHTHSPKAGQGMNVSIQDSYNLGWKIGLVVNGIAKRSILKTYQSERRRIAQDLIAFDHRFSRLFSGKPAKDAADQAGISMAEFKEAFEKGNMFASGVAVDYGVSELVAKGGDSADQGDGRDLEIDDIYRVVGKQYLATNINMGMRFPSFQVLNQADARPWQFCHFLKSDGRFRIILFAGNLGVKEQWQRVQKFGEELAKPDTFIHRFTPPDRSIDSIIEIFMIHSAPRTEVEFLDLHEVFHPFDEQTGYNYDRIFVDDQSYHEGHGEAYMKYGVNMETGCVVIVRPDQYVGWVGDLEDMRDIDLYFSKILLPRK